MTACDIDHDGRIGIHPGERLPMIRIVWRRLRAARRREAERRVFRRLLEQGDHMLRDIGVTRAEAERLVYGRAGPRAAPRPDLAGQR